MTEIKKCAECGEEMANEAVFCSKCGSNFFSNNTTEESKESESLNLKNVEGKIKDALTLESVEAGTERNGRNVVISFMSPTMYKIAFIGLLILGIIGFLQGGVVVILIDIFVLKFKFAAWVKGFIVDYDKETIYVSKASVTFDTGFDIKRSWETFRKGIEFRFDELKTLDAEYEQTVEENNNRYQVKSYKIINCVTTFGTVKIKLNASDSRFEKILTSLQDVLVYNNNI